MDALSFPSDYDVSSVKVCFKHFSPDEFTIVRSRYLKSKAVPSKHLNHNPKKPIEFQRRLFKPAKADSTASSVNGLHLETEEFQATVVEPQHLEALQYFEELPFFEESLVDKNESANNAENCTCPKPDAAPNMVNIDRACRE
ncbi:hypothetical protein pipiens_005601 [Culex pipiens pipiens]|uniref:THAP-type domain-containing protein n=1 Tax=Culex pipiens pipiens TaxID=38569 RepID=A0ABD1DVI6_CULPP